MDKQMTETLEAIHGKCAANEDNLITVLQEIQSEFGYIREDVVNWFSERSNIPPSKYYGVVTFYSQFHQKSPWQKHCHGMLWNSLPRQGCATSYHQDSG
jgi:NADH:ubiquinone oxidoreductase subunit E